MEGLDSQLSFLHERALPDLAANIKCGNSLVGPDYYGDKQLGLAGLDDEDRFRINVFDWEDEFPDVLGRRVSEDRRGFDAVIGNPPYRMIQPHNTEDALLAYVRARYPETEFKVDLYHLFLLRGTTLLAPGGSLGYIVPTPLLNNVYAETLRRTLMDRCKIEMLSVARGKVFATADVHTTVVVLRREDVDEERATNAILATSQLDASVNHQAPAYTKTSQSLYSKMPGCVWNILVTDDNAAILEKMANVGTTLGEVATINRGLITGARGEFFSELPRDDRDVPIIAGADVQRYFTNPPSKFVRFERPDSAGGCWLPEVHFSPHKVVMRQIGVAPTASYLGEPIAVTGNIFTVRCDSAERELFALGVLNSRAMSYFWKVMFADFKSTFPQFTIFSVSQAPIPRMDPTPKSQALRAHVEAMLAAREQTGGAALDQDRVVLEREAARIDRCIDELVYDLYGLDGDEIAIIEAQSRPV